MSLVYFSRSLGLCAVVVALSVPVAGCGGGATSDGFCCTTAESCAVIGAALTPCTDPAAPYCDDLGGHGPPRICIPDPEGLSCEGPADCTIALPFCFEGKCVGCEGDGDCSADAPVCDPTDLACGACTTDEACARFADASRCETTSGGCFECLASVDCAVPTTPVCDDAHACRSCQADDECLSELCDEATGACVAESLIIYVATTGTANASCTREIPCATIAQALEVQSPTRQLIKIRPGTYEAALTFNGITVTLIGPGAVIQVATVDTSPVTIGANSDVTIEGARIRGANGPGMPDGVRCLVVTPEVARLTLRSVLVDDNAGQGVSAHSGCELHLERSTIRNNRGGGVYVDAGSFSIINNVITGNSGPSSIGGVNLSGISTAGLHKLAFNTITANSASSPGIVCNNVSVPIAMANNIVWANGTGAQVTADANCTHTYSVIGPTGTTGATNLNIDPRFVSAGVGDYHLMANSPARDVADPAAITPVDIDGDARPQGLRADIGADEILP